MRSLLPACDICLHDGILSRCYAASALGAVVCEPCSCDGICQHNRMELVSVIWLPALNGVHLLKQSGSAFCVIKALRH